MRLTQEEWETAKAVCTPEQLEVLALWRAGWGYKLIARRTAMPLERVKGRIRRARDRIDLALDAAE